MAKDWKGLSNRVVSLVGLTTKPLGFKFFKSAEELKDIKGIERSTFKRTVCQFIGNARRLGKGWGADADDQLCQEGAWYLGIVKEEPEGVESGLLYTEPVLNIASAEVGRMIAKALPKNKDQFEAFAVMPLDGGAVGEITFEPDLVIIYGEPGQLTKIIMPTCAALKIPAFEGRIIGDTGICADGIPACWNSGEPKFFLPCIGDRAFGATQSGECAVVYPADKFNEAVVSNMEKMNWPNPAAVDLLLDAPLGAIEEVVGLMEAMSPAYFALKRGVPLIPEKPS